MFSELNDKNFPIFEQELSIRTSCQCLAGLWPTDVFPVVETYRELAPWLLLIGVVWNEQVTTTKNWSSLWVVRNRKLRQVQFEFLFLLDWKDECLQLFVCTPVFLWRVPNQRSIPSPYFAVLVLHQSQGVGNVITFIMKLCNRKVEIACSIKQFKVFDFSIEEVVNWWHFCNDLAVKGLHPL